MKITQKISIALVALTTQFAFAQNSLLYKVEGDSIQDSYVYGTIHMMPQKDFEMKDKVKNAFNEAEVIYLELDMDDPNMLKEMMSLMTLKEGETLNEYMDEDEYTFLDAYFKENFKMSLTQFSKFKPFYLSSMLMTKMMGEQVASFELSFVQMAKAASKDLKGLETVAEQIAVFDKQPLDEQIDDIIKMIKDDSSLELFDTMVEIYKKEDVEELFEYMDDYFDNDAAMMEALLINRNKNWVTQIPIISKVQTVFYAVGAGHLGGKEGVLQLLKDEGYKVTPVLD